MTLKSLLRGKTAEQQAVKYLKNHGLKVLEKNKRYPCGELDIVAADKNTHLFVEVKYRSNAEFGGANEMISASKQAKLVKAAKLWLQENDPQFEKACRFDVIAIDNSQNERSLTWVKNAFTPELW